jgi:hypothetical protein
MKKRKDILAIIVYFIAAYFSANTLGNEVYLHILSIAFIIAGTYGIVCLSKKEKFLF